MLERFELTNPLSLSCVVTASPVFTFGSDVWFPLSSRMFVNKLPGIDLWLASLYSACGDLFWCGMADSVVELCDF